MCCGHFLGIVEKRMEEIGRKDYGCRKDWTRQRAAAGLIATCLYEILVDMIFKVWNYLSFHFR